MAHGAARLAEVILGSFVLQQSPTLRKKNPLPEEWALFSIYLKLCPGFLSNQVPALFLSRISVWEPANLQYFTCHMLSEILLNAYNI